MASRSSVIDDLLANGRPKSVDVGGLALALANQGLGQGWGGFEPKESGGTRYAELLSDMYTHTLTLVNHHSNQLLPIVDIPETRRRLIESLDNWHFEPHKLPDEEVLSCTLILFETLFRIEGMKEETGVSLSELSGFLQHLGLLYRGQNAYHNYQHALDVLQASHAFLCSEGVVPPVSILLDSGDRPWKRKYKNNHSLSSELRSIELFALYVAAIGHDVGHPGLTNMFMKNAQTGLSAVYDDKSALEQMHYTVLTRAMRHHRLGFLLDRADTVAWFRKLLCGIILATDMGVHNTFMENFASLANGACTAVCERRLLICQAIIKCADISNPSRPLGVSHHWASALMDEWTSQANLEKHFSLPPSVNPTDTPLGKAKSQVFFIQTFAKPLMDLTARVLPGMTRFARYCTRNLRFWEARCREYTAAGDIGPSPAAHGPGNPGQPHENFLTAFPMALPPFVFNSQSEPPAPDWQSTYTFSEHSSSSSDSDSQHDAHTTRCDWMSTEESSPISPTDSLRSSPRSPHSEDSTSRQSQVSIVSSGSTGHNHATTAMRAAFQASGRKKKTVNRNSWNPLSVTCAALSPYSTTPKSSIERSIIVADADTASVPVESRVTSDTTVVSRRPPIRTDIESIV